MRTIRFAASTLATLAICLAAVGVPVSASGPTTRYVDDDGRAGPGCGSGRDAFRRIQAAVDASHAGDIVKVCPGTYREHVVIGPAKDGLRLVAATGKRPTLRPVRHPTSFSFYSDEQEQRLVRPRGVVHVRGATQVVVRGLRFLPSGLSGTCAEGSLITVFGHASAEIVDNVFGGIPPFDTSCRRYSSAVEVVREDIESPTWVVVRGNIVRDFGGAVGSHLGFVKVLRNRFSIRAADQDGDRDRAVISGDGHQFVVADNVVSVGGAPHVFFFRAGLGAKRGASAAITGNVVDGVGTGITVTGFDGRRRGSVVIQDNVLIGGYSAYIETWGINLVVVDALVSGNVVTGFGWVGMWDDSRDGVIRDNDFRGNAFRDCWKAYSSGSTWRRNLGYRSDPRGLCSRY